MADGKIIIETDLDKTGIEKSLGQLGSIASKGSKVAIGAIAGVTTAVGGVATASIKVGMDFESSMSQVAATMGITSQEISSGSKSFEMLKQAAKDAGASTQFSASESAEALNYLALAGYDAEKAVQALPTVLNLAAAGGLELGYASDLVTDSMASLGLETSQLEGFVDQLAKTSQKSNTSVGQLGEAILTVGGTAKVLAGGTTELNTALGILADNGVKGAEGGTALRNVILSLSAPTDQARDKMKELGLEVFDAQGNMRPLNDIFNDLNGILGTMSQGEQTQVLSKLFNKVDLKSVNALLANSGERFNELSGYISNADGAAAQMAETMNDNLKGRLTQLSSALEGLGVDIYEQMELPLKSMAEQAIKSVGQLHNALKNNGIDGLVQEVGNVLADVISQIANSAPKFIDLSVDLIQSFISGINSNLPSVVEGASKIITSLVNGIATLLPEFLDVGLKVILELIKGISSSLPELVPVAVDSILTLVDTLIQNADLLTDAAIALILGLAEGLIKSLPTLIEKVPKLVSSLSNAFSENTATLIIAAGQLMGALAIGLIQSIPALLQAIPSILKAIVDFFLSGFMVFIELGKQLTLLLWNSIKDECINGWNMIVSFFTETIPGWIESFKEWWNGLPEYFAQLWESVKAKFLEWGTNISSFFTETIPAKIEEFKNWWNGLPEYFAQLWENVKAKFIEWGTNISNFFTETIPGWIESIRAWFNELPYKIGEALGFALGTIYQWGVNTYNYFATNIPLWIESISTWFSEMPGKVWTWLCDCFNKVKEWGMNVYNSFSASVTSTVEAVSTWFSEMPGKVWNWLNDCINKIKDWGSQTYNNAKDAAQRAIDAVSQWFSQMPGRVWSWLSNVIDKVRQWGSDMVEKGRKAANDTVNKVVDGFKNLPNKIKQKGKEVVEGLWNGIVGMKDWLWGKITGFCGGIVDGFKKALRINSPSKIMRDKIGVGIVEGIDVGIDKEMPNLDKNIDYNMNEMTSKMQRAIKSEQVNVASTFSLKGNYEVNQNNNDTEIVSILTSIMKDIKNIDPKIFLDSKELILSKIEMIKEGLNDSEQRNPKFI